MVEQKLYIILAAINYLQFIFFSIIKNYIHLKERILLTIFLIVKVFCVFHYLTSIFTWIPFFSILQVYFIIKKNDNFLLSSVIISIEISFIILTNLLSNSLFAILNFNNNFNSYVFIAKIILQQVLLLLSLNLLNYYDFKYHLFETLSVRKKNNPVLTIIIFIYMYILIHLKNAFLESSYQLLYLTLCFLFLIFSILCLLVSYYINKYFLEKEYTSVLSDIYKEEKIHFDRTEEFRHDYKNILISLTGYLEHNNLEEAVNFLQEITFYSKDSIQINLAQSIILIKIPPVQSVLNNFIKECLSLNIKVDLQVYECITDLNMQLVDFIRCLSILLKNALEASELTHDPYIWICFSKNNIETMVEISNSSLNMEPLTYQSLFTRKFTTKKDHKGIGLSIFSKIMSQYNNIHYVFTNKEERFTVTLYIENKNPIPKI